MRLLLRKDLLEAPFAMTIVILEVAVGAQTLVAVKTEVAQPHVVHLTRAFSLHILRLQPPQHVFYNPTSNIIFAPHWLVAIRTSA